MLVNLFSLKSKEIKTHRLSLLSVTALPSVCKLEKHDPNKAVSFNGKEWDALWDTGVKCSVMPL